MAIVRLQRSTASSDGGGSNPSIRQAIERGEAAMSEQRRIDDAHFRALRAVPPAKRSEPPMLQLADEYHAEMDRLGEQLKAAEHAVATLPAWSLSDVIAKVEWLWSGEVEDHDPSNFEGKAFRALLADLRRLDRR